MASKANAQTYVSGTTVATSGGDATCQEAVKAVVEAASGLSKACDGDPSCISKNLSCSDEVKRLGSSALEGASAAEACTALVSESCPELNQSYDSAAADKRDAGKARKEAMDTKEKANDEFSKAQKDAQKKQQDTAKQMVELRQQYREKRKQMQDENEKQLSEANKAKMAAVKEAQEQLDKIDQEYITLRDGLRKQADVISNGELQWKVGCRSAAYAESAKVQAAMDEQTLAEQKAVNQINNSSSNLFGLRYRRLNKKRQRIADRYNEVLTRCLKGEIDPGASKKVEIDKARLSFASEEKRAQDLDQVLKQRKTNINNQLEELKKSTDQELAKAAKRLQRDLADADKDFQENMQLLQQQQAAAQQTANKGQEANLRKLEEADRDLQNANREQALANNRAMCISQTSGRGSSVSTTQTSNVLARSAVVKGAAACPALYTKKCDMEAQYRDLCGQLNTAAKGINGGASSPSGGGAPAAQ